MSESSEKPRFSWDDVKYMIEIPGVYDGWSVVVFKDGTKFNRWSDPDDPTQPAKGYERPFRAAQDYIDGMDQ